MQRTILGYIWRHSLKQQAVILAVTLAALPTYYVSLTLPKTIVNDALSGDRSGGTVWGVNLDAVGYLLILCFAYLGLVVINGAIKYVINVYKGVVAERMLRRLRYDLFGRVLRFPPGHFRKMSPSETSQMINGEVEFLGGFIAEAYALPAYQGGMLLTTLLFVFMQSPFMGLAAISLYPLQIYIIPKLQRQVNQLGRERVRQVRRNAERIGETVAGVRDIRANDATQFERARFSQDLWAVYRIRYRIYIKKFLIKFLNNFMSQLTPFFFFSIGGYLVLQGELTLGALVAALTAFDNLDSPWKELLNHYQLWGDSAVKYEQVVAQFNPPGMLPEERQSAEPPDGVAFEGRLRAINLTLQDEGETVLDGISFSLDMPTRAAVVGPPGSGNDALGLVLAGLLAPDTGRVLIGEHDLHRLPESVTGRRIAYVANPAHLFAGTIRDNLLYGLKHRPVQREWADPQEKLEAKRSANSSYDARADWVDLKALGLDSEESFLRVLVETLGRVRLEDDVYGLGLRRAAPEDSDGDLAERVLEARRAVHRRLRGDRRLGRLVEFFDVDRYNDNASLAENLLFGSPTTEEFAPENLADHPYVLKVLGADGLLADLYVTGYRVAETMVELFAELPPDHEYYRQFSFIAPDDLPDYRALVGRVTADRVATLDEGDRRRLLALTFKIIPARHRLDLLDDGLKSRLLDARRRLRLRIPEAYARAIAFFEPDRFNGAASLQDNILFGKIAYGQAQAQERVNRLITEVVGELGLRERIIAVGLDADVGVGGSRFTVVQRQKLALARGLLKRPDLLVVADAVAPLDAAEQVAVVDAVVEASEGRTVVWFLQRTELIGRFEHVLALRDGRVVEEGRPDAITQARDDRDPAALTAAE